VAEVIVLAERALRGVKARVQINAGVRGGFCGLHSLRLQAIPMPPPREAFIRVLQECARALHVHNRTMTVCTCGRATHSMRAQTTEARKSARGSCVGGAVL
jgi:hypothetical protein